MVTLAAVRLDLDDGLADLRLTQILFASMMEGAASELLAVSDERAGCRERCRGSSTAKGSGTVSLLPWYLHPSNSSCGPGLRGLSVD
jgi:hypothetical protein